RRRPLGSEPAPPVAQVGRPVRIAFLGLSEPAIPYETRGSRARRSLLAAGALGIAAVTLASAHAQNASGSPRPDEGGGEFAQVLRGEPPQPNVEQVFGGAPTAAPWTEGSDEFDVFYGHIHSR
ncbi:hypothetical protein, partial [Sporichthya sp.]|uniref:hypothetical protein n=1 Tax=Sporichthya sp. TaxID=65475 RepID=UPI00185D2CFE